MKVKDLIGHLQKFNPDMRVVVCGFAEDGVCDCDGPTEATIVPDQHKMEWMGPHWMLSQDEKDKVALKKYPQEQVVFIRPGD